MSSRPWYTPVPSSQGRAESARPRCGQAWRAVLAGVVAIVALGGCASFRDSNPIPQHLGPSIAGDIVAAGVLIEPPPGQGAPQAAVEEAGHLADALGRASALPALDVASLELLLQPPDLLSANATKLRDLRFRLGHRFAAVAWRRTSQLRHSTTWNATIVVPLPFLWVFFNWPIPVTSPSSVAHDARMVRIVDLERAELVSESFLVTRGSADEKPFTRRELRSALDEIEWGKE